MGVKQERRRAEGFRRGQTEPQISQMTQMPLQVLCGIGAICGSVG